MVSREYSPLDKVGLTDADLDIIPSDDDRRTMHSFTPHEGRYARYTDPLRKIISEYEWVRRRLALEIEYLIGLGDEFSNYTGEKRKLIEQPFSDREKDAMRDLYSNFSEIDFMRFKRIERETDHDVVAMTILGLYNMGDVVPPDVMERAMHFGRTSSDMDSTTFSLMVQDIVSKYYLPGIFRLQKLFIEKAYEWHQTSKDIGRPFTVMAAQTHEQYAVPTPIIKVMANFVYGLDQGLSKFIVNGSRGESRFKLYGKMRGAVGNDSAMKAAYPDHDWNPFYRELIEGMGLDYQPMTDQDESNMRFLELISHIVRTNLPLLKWSDDYSSYLSRGVLKKKTKRAHTGSSIMPQKINPWRTEGGEFFLLMAEAEFNVFKLLAKQRKQGDLRRSALKRYFGIPISNVGIALGRFYDDLRVTSPNFEGVEKELIEHPELAAASMQHVLKRDGVPKAYDLMVKKTRGLDLTPDSMKGIVDELIAESAIDGKTGRDIVNIFNPNNNVGDSLERAEEKLTQARATLQSLGNLYEIDIGKL
jgi:adenylosuccinate lyase